MIPHHLIVPWRRHTLKECHEIIKHASGVRDWVYTTPKPDEEVELHKSWLDACLNESKKRLTPWEESFLLSLADQLDMKGFLSEKQASILERIYTEKT